MRGDVQEGLANGRARRPRLRAPAERLARARETFGGRPIYAGDPETRELVEREAELAGLGSDRRAVDVVLRALDVLIAASVLALLWPVMALIALAIRVTSGSPVLYRGLRVGRGGEPFQMYKFRTLRPDAETRLGPFLGHELTRRTGGETTRMGWVLRKSQLDELPQLLNVLRGDMSIVGPRPIRPAFYESLSEAIPQYWQRLVVRPGMTGFAQTRMIREMSWEEKLAHDLEYVADRSVRLYLELVVATISRVAVRTGAALRPDARS